MQSNQATLLITRSGHHKLLSYFHLSSKTTIANCYGNLISC